MHPKLEPLIQSEVKKLLDAKIIFKVRHSEWVSNLVPVRKNSGEIRLYVDFKNLNRAADKDNYPAHTWRKYYRWFQVLNYFRY